MITFTDLDDTPESIAHEWAGHNDASLAKGIKEANKNTFAWQAFDTNHFAPERAIWIPSKHDPDNYIKERILDSFDWIPSGQLAMLKRAQEEGINPYDMIASYRYSKRANELTNDASIGLTGGAFGFTTAHNAIDLKKDNVGKFDHWLKEIRGNLQEMAGAKDQISAETAKAKYSTSLKEMNRIYAHEIKAFRFRNAPWFQDNWTSARMMRKHGWHIFDEAVVHDVERASKFLRKLGRGCWVLDIGSSVVDIVLAAVEGKPWYKEAEKGALDMVLTASITAVEDAGLAALALTPVGWVGILAVAAVEAATTMVATHYLDKDLK